MHRSVPGLVVGRVANLRFHLADIEHHVLGLKKLWVMVCRSQLVTTHLVVHRLDVVHGDLRERISERLEAVHDGRRGGTVVDVDDGDDDSSETRKKLDYTLFPWLINGTNPPRDDLDPVLRGTLQAKENYTRNATTVRDSFSRKPTYHHS